MLYYCWYGLLILRNFAYPFFGVKNDVLLTLLISAFLLFDLFLYIQRNNHKIAKFFIFLCLYVGLIVTANRSVVSVFNIFASCYLLKNIDLTKIFLFKTCVEIICIIVLMFGLATGLIQDVLRSNEYKGLGYSHNLGFPNSNGPSAIGMGLVLALYYFGVQFNSFLIYLLGIIFSVFVFSFTGGRTYFFLEIILFITGLFAYSRKTIKALRFLGVSLFIIIIILLAVMIIIIKSPQFEQIVVFINGIASWRLGYFTIALKEFSIMNLILGKQGIVVDQAYLVLLTEGGILVIITLFYFYLKFIKIENIERCHKLVPIIIALLIGGFTEATFSYYSSTSLIFWLILYKAPYKINMPKIVLT